MYKLKQKILSSLLALSMVLAVVQPALANTLQLQGDKTSGTNYWAIGTTVYSNEIQLSDSGYIVAYGKVETEEWSDYLYGLIDIHENVVLQFQFQHLKYLTGDMYVANNYDGNGWFGVRADGSRFNMPVSDDYSVRGIGNYINFFQMHWDNQGNIYEEHLFYDQNLNKVSESTVNASIDWAYTPNNQFHSDYLENPETGDYECYLFNSDGYEVLGPSSWIEFPSEEYTDFMKPLDGNSSTVVPVIMQSSSIEGGVYKDTSTTIFMDYATGEVFGEFPYRMSNINQDGYYVYHEDGNEYIAHTDQAYWITGEAPPENVQYEALPSAVQYSSYLTEIPNIDEHSTLVSGSLPLGLGIYPDGTIGGIPSKTGTYNFIINTTVGDLAYSITVLDNSVENVEADNDYAILDRIPTVTSNDVSYTLRVDGDFQKFLNVYLNGVLLVRDVDYTAEEGSTKLNFNANTFAQLDPGDHTVNVTYAPTVVTPSTGTAATASQAVTVDKVSQTFNKTVEKTPVPAMPFEDVEEAHWFYDSVLMMYKQGTFSGVTPTTYEPGTGMSRAMMAMVLYAMADKPETTSAALSDVTPGAWFEPAVNWIINEGIDDSSEFFRPSELITREETAKMIYNFCTSQAIWLPLVSSSSPNDMDYVNESARLHVDALYQRGIFAGDDMGNFNPGNSSTRAEVSTVMKNFMSIVL